MSTFENIIDRRIESRIKDYAEAMEKKFDEKLKVVEQTVLAAIPTEMQKHFMSQLRGVFAPVFQTANNEQNATTASNLVAHPVATVKKKKTTNISGNPRRKPVAQASMMQQVKIAKKSSAYDSVTQYDVYKKMLMNGFQDVTSDRQKRVGTLVLYDGGKYTYTFYHHKDHVLRRTGHVSSGTIIKGMPLYGGKVKITPGAEKKFTSSIAEKSNLSRYNMYRSAFQDLLEKKFHF